jgi:ABC-type transporter Mla subunit MlaD
VNPRYLDHIPANVVAEIQATTVFGNKYISFSSPKDPSKHHLSPHAVIDATSVTTEFNTLFETVTAIAEQVDPIKVNQTLTATGRGAHRTWRPVRRIAGERQPDRRRPEQSDAADHPRHPRGRRPRRRLRRRVA